MTNLTQTNKQIQTLDIQGDVVPQIWYNHIKYKTEKGKTKTDLLAIAILANTVYWYRPTEIRDEATNKVIGYKKKFESDMLQRSYAQLGNFYGKTKREVKSSIALLVELNLIKTEFRSIYIRGVLHNNVMYIDLNVDEIRKISMVDDMQYTPPSKKRNTLSQKNDIGSYKKKTEPHTQIGNTNTEITTETITHNITKKETSFPSQDKVTLFFEHHKKQLMQTRKHGDPDLHLVDKLGTLIEWDIETYDKILKAKQNSTWEVRRNQPNTAKWLLATMENENLETAKSNVVTFPKYDLDELRKEGFV